VRAYVHSNIPCSVYAYVPNQNVGSRPDEIEVIYSLLGGDKKHEMIIISLYVERYAYRK